MRAGRSGSKSGTTVPASRPTTNRSSFSRSSRPSLSAAALASASPSPTASSTRTAARLVTSITSGAARRSSSSCPSRTRQPHIRAMTERLYYADAYLREFDAAVTRVDREHGRTLVYLDRTAFYPTSGGQPFDTGALNSIHVIDVVDEDGEIAHVVDADIAEGQTVHGEIDWTRRFDHMQ